MLLFLNSSTPRVTLTYRFLQPLSTTNYCQLMVITLNLNHVVQQCVYVVAGILHGFSGDLTVNMLVKEF